MNLKVPHIHSKPHEFFPMTSHVSRRHLVVFGSWAPGKSKSVYYNLQFWLFLGHFWTFLGLVVFSPETFIGVPTWLVILRGYPAPFALSRKVSEHPICSFLVKKLPRNEPKGIHIFVQSHMTTFQWPPMSLRNISECSELGPRESPKACIYNLQFWLFLWNFWTFLGLVIFSLVTFIGVPS